MTNICDTCIKSDTSCPIWSPSHRASLDCIEYDYEEEDKISKEHRNEAFVQDESC